MDKSLILGLVFDGRCYGDRIKPFDNKEYSKNFDKLYELLENLCKDLPEKEKLETLNNIHDAHCAMESFTADEHFKEGFKLGLKIGAQNFLD